MNWPRRRSSSEALRGESRDVEACILGTPDLGAAERVRIYSDMFVWRQVDALREDFPEVAARLGEDRFFRLALRLALEGEPLGEICGAFGEPAPAFEALQSWLAEGWIAAVEPV